MDKVTNWLGSLNLQEYSKKFEDNGWDDLSVVAMMTKSDIGSVVHKAGHVIKLLKASRSLGTNYTTTETVIKKEGKTLLKDIKPTEAPETNVAEISPTFIKQPLDQISIPGEKIEIKCVVNFRPRYVEWYRNDKKYMTQDNFGKGKVTSYSISLLIKADKLDHNNEYKCRTWYGPGDNDYITSRSITVTIKDEGYNLSQFDTNRQVSSVNSGGVKFIPGNDSPKKLPKEEETIHDLSPNLFASSKGSVETDSITESNETNNPTLQNNPILIKKDDISSIIDDSPGFLKQPGNVTIKPGGSTEIQCIVNFRPVKVIWFQNDRQILIRNDFGTGTVYKYTVSLFVTPDSMDSGSRFKCQIWYGKGIQESIISWPAILTIQGEWTIPSPTARNEGEWTISSPTARNEELNYSVKSVEQPGFIKQPEDTTIWINSEFELKCIVNFRPKHSIWYMNNKKHAEQTDFGSSSPVSKFTITLVTEPEPKSSKSEFRCQVWYGDDPQEYIMSRTAVLVFGFVQLTTQTTNASTASNSETSTASTSTLKFITTIVTAQPITRRTDLSLTNASGKPLGSRTTISTASLQSVATNANVQKTFTSVPTSSTDPNSPRFFAEPPEKINSRGSGSTVEIECVSNFRPVKVKWYENNENILTREDFGTGNAYKFSVSLRFTPETNDEGNKYNCQVFYGPGENDFIKSRDSKLVFSEESRKYFSSTIHPTTIGTKFVSQNESLPLSPVFIVEQTDISVNRGEKVELKWSVNFTPKKVEWLKDDRLYTSSDDFEVDEQYVFMSTVLLQLPAATNKQAGIYNCKVWYGSAKEDFIISKRITVTVM